MVATLMFFEMQNWSPDPKDLTNIERLMDNSGRRLELARGGEKTQDIQKKIVFRLDELIKELENQNKPAGQCNGGNCPSGGGKPGNNPRRHHCNPSRPGPGQRHHGRQRRRQGGREEAAQIAEKWGTLPPEKRAKIVEDITRDLPAEVQADDRRLLQVAQQDSRVRSEPAAPVSRYSGGGRDFGHRPVRLAALP